MTPTAIAIFVKNLTSGGAEKQAILLAKALRDDYEVYFVVFNAAKTHRKYLDAIRELEGVRLALFSGGHLSRFRQLRSYIKENNIELVFSYLTAANLYACLASIFRRTKVVTGLRNAELPAGKQFADRLLTNHMAALTIANCYSGKENFVSKGFKEKKILVIPNCFDNISPSVPKEERSIVRIISVGRFVEQKDYQTAIRTVAKTYRTYKDIRFSIIGFGEQEQNIRQWVKQEGIADITDIFINPDNIPRHLSDADIMLSTSLFEGTSNSIMEGMNADLPIIATKAGDNALLVRHGENGFLAEKRDADALAQHLKKLITDKELRRKLGEKSKEILRENYSLSTFRNRYLQVIKELR